MDYVWGAISKGDVVLQCPYCNHEEHRTSMFPSHLLCVFCKKSAKVTEWVSFIRRVGDADAYSNISIAKNNKPSGFVFYVDTSQQSNQETKGICFYARDGGGNSPHFFQSLVSFVNYFSRDSDDPTQVCITSQGERLRIYQDPQGFEIRINTESLICNESDDVSYSPKVLLKREYQFTLRIPMLIEALLSDIKKQTMSPY